MISKLKDYLTREIFNAGEKTTFFQIDTGFKRCS